MKDARIKNLEARIEKLLQKLDITQEQRGQAYGLVEDHERTIRRLTRGRDEAVERLQHVQEQLDQMATTTIREMEGWTADALRTAIAFERVTSAELRAHNHQLRVNLHGARSDLEQIARALGMFEDHGGGYIQIATTENMVKAIHEVLTDAARLRGALEEAQREIGHPCRVPGCTQPRCDLARSIGAALAGEGEVVDPVAAERERCARIAEAHPLHPSTHTGERQRWLRAGIAEAIRKPEKARQA